MDTPLHGTPRNSVPVHRSARRSVHVGGNRLGVQLALRFQRSYQVCLTGSPGPRQLPCRPGIASRIRPVMREIAGGQRLAFPVSCCLSAAGVRFLDHPVPLGISAFLAVGLPGSASCRPGPQPGVLPSGPFTTPAAAGTAFAVPAACAVMVSNLPFGSSVIVIVCLTGSPDPRQRPFGPGHQPGIRPVIRDGQRRGQPPCPGFLLPFGCRRSLPGSSCSRPGPGPSSRSAYRARYARTRTGLPRSALRDTTGVGSGKRGALLRPAPLRTGLEWFPFIRLKQALLA